MPIFDDIKEQVTVAVCKRCARGADIQALGDKLWCAWCGKECEVEHKTIEVVSKQTFERLHVNAGGQFIDPENVPVQPLRITSGWKVMMRNHLFEIDPTPETVQSFHWFNRTMLVMRHEGKNCLLDVGWSDEMNFEGGHYCLTLYENDYGGEELYAYTGRDRLELVKQIETVLEKVTNYREISRKSFR